MTRSARWAFAVATVATTGLALVLVFVLALTTESQGIVERHFGWLMSLTVTVAALLIVVIVLAAVRLAVRWRRGKFGSRLLAKLAGIFALVGVLPGVLIYTVSYQFVSRSIEVWFDARVQSALSAGLALGRDTLDAQVRDLAARTRLAAQRLGEGRPAVAALELERLREQLGAEQVVLATAAGLPVVAVGPRGDLQPDRPPATMLRQARSVGVVAQIEGLDDETVAAAPAAVRVRAVAIVPSTAVTLAGDGERFLAVVQPVPARFVANALAVQGAYREYQQRALARDGLRKVYIGTLTLALVLAVFGAVLVAALLGNQLAKPLLLLAEGVRQVAEGDLTAKPVFASHDELGGLTRDFAAMTEQLGQARGEVERGVARLESARTHLQTILDSLTAGVIVFDAQRRIASTNPGATRILKQPLAAWRGRQLGEVPGLDSLAQAVWQRFELHAASPEAGERDQWQDSFELPLAEAPVDERVVLTLLVRGATLPDEERLMVFDDISEVVSAQRAAAWAEVARRLAHEIKNPLTPIQLSAERLRHKLEGRLEGDEAALLRRSVTTIVQQVQAMKQLVDEFRDYARLPAAQLEPLDLNALVTEVLGLYGQPIEQGRLVAECEPALPWIVGDATQLRQVIHNLVQNALDAVAEQVDGRVHVVTESARNELGELRAVRLKIVDNGPGFAEKVLKRAFEPYVTTKTRGTGLGLAVVKKIVDEHAARVRLGNLAGAGESGAQVSISFSKLAPQPAAQVAG